MGNEISTPAAAPNAVNAPTSYAYIKFALSMEILFEILAFVKFYEAPNIFLVNRYLLPICQVYFHSGTVGHNKVRNVRDFGMQLTEGSLTILVKRNGTLQSVPVPEVDPPKILKAFGYIKVKKCCQIQAMEFLNKFSSLLTKKNNMILCARNFFPNNDNAVENEANSNLLSSDVVDEKQLFLNLIEQKGPLLKLFDPSFEGIARCLADVPLIARFNGSLSIEFNNQRNLCGLKEEAKFIYGWISAVNTRQLRIRHYDAQKARELANQIVLLFEQAHVNKIEADKMKLKIWLPKDTVVPMQMQKICNKNGDQLATLRTFSYKSSNGNGIYAAYIFRTKPMEYYYENKEELELGRRNAIIFS